MTVRPAPLNDARDVSRVAYGFMGSQAMFAALHLDLFTHLEAGAKTPAGLAAATGASPSRLATLLAACASLGLIVKAPDGYANAPASREYLVRTSPKYFGDYFRFQIDRVIYPAFGHLTDALRGERLQFYDLTQGTAETQHFVRGQHAGSLGPATVLSRQVDLTHRRKLLDVAGGSGAFSIVLCKRFPDLKCTILDLPGVVPIARQFVDDAQLSHRIDFLPGNAFEVEWPRHVDIVLISYLLSAVASAAIPELLRRALAALVPGGQIVLHDFMMDDDETGPTTAALWLMYGLLCDPDAVLLTPGRLSSDLSKAGFAGIEVFDTIPTVTRTLAATKP